MASSEFVEFPTGKKAAIVYRSRRVKTLETEEEHSGLAKPQTASRTEQSVSKDPDLSIDLEPDINLEREFDAVRKRGHLEQQYRESRGRHKEDVFSKKRYAKKCRKK